MSFTNEQKIIVQTTFAQVSDADRLASRFYDRLFEIDPTTRPMFRHEMTEQRKKLMQTIAVVVNALDRLETIVPAIQDLGRRHVAYGVTPAHWDSVGAALLWALEDAFGAAFTAEVRDAWAAAYGLIAATALDAAATVGVSSPANDAA
ncbi:MAG: hemin receptor [Chloroflexi bacterium]|nr:hemin receptor [Chloroflexota bacterium]